MKFDDILTNYVGESGRYQIFLYNLVCLVAIPSAIITFSIVFLAAETNHYCRVDGCSSDSCGFNVTQSQCQELIKAYTIPRNKDGSYAQCQRFENVSCTHMPFWLNGTDSANATLMGEEEDCKNGWIYDKSQYHSTVIQEWDLVCEGRALVPLHSSIYMAGKFAGSLFFGWFSDRIGRKPAILIASTSLVSFGIVTAFSPNFLAFTIFRFILGATGTGCFMLAFVIGTEIVGKSKRSWAGFIIEIYFAVGYMLIPLIAYFVRDWRKFQLAISAPWLILLMYFCLLPESPRWLLSVGKNKEAEKVLRKIAEKNKTTLPEDFSELTIKLNKEKDENLEDVRPGNFTDLFKYPNLRKKTFNIFYNWFVNTMVYYGLGLSTSRLGGNDYLNAFLSAAVEVPAYLLSMFIIDTSLGRRYSLAITMCIGGAACIMAKLIPSHLNWLTVTLAMTGKLGIAASFAIIYLFSAELYPTPVRSIGMGLSSVCGRIGGIIAPQLTLLETYWEPFPFVIYGGLSVLAGLLALLLPETRRMTLPETIEDGEKFGKKNYRPNQIL